jgi:hypothetical protein
MRPWRGEPGRPDVGAIISGLCLAANQIVCCDPADRPTPLELTCGRTFR